MACIAGGPATGFRWSKVLVDTTVPRLRHLDYEYDPYGNNTIGTRWWNLGWRSAEHGADVPLLAWFGSVGGVGTPSGSVTIEERLTVCINANDRAFLLSLHITPE